MPNPFIYQAQPGRVVFGASALQQLEAELDALGAGRAIVLSTPEQRAGAEAIAHRLGERSAGVFDRAVMHVPIETAREAREVARERGADCAIALGGGSTIGLGKAIALDSGLPILAVPTTYAGSEMTPIYGITQNGEKRTGTDARVLPRTVIYDPELTLTLPVAMSVTSGINAIAHAAEGLYAANGNPITSLMALEGIRALAIGLPGIHDDPRDIEARGSALYGAWLCGTVLAHGGMALHHKLCHTLGGSFNLPHAQTHTVVLPYVLAFNAPFAEDAMRRMAQALGTQYSAAAGVWELAHRNGAPTSLRELGMSEPDLDRAADIATERPYWNPRPLDRAAVRAVLQSAFEGARPA
ncbi:maleylacetate reductase [Paraburkholderia bannensis]|uniref:maleylacetate reductase n=1 Tax=Paraburkholderia bannensis TaxID=765414 RepID=UPI002AC3506D|nr:maleylacetate reductase [Paraburkholderia bannensis]